MPGLFVLSYLVPVHFPPMPYAQGQNDQLLVVDEANQAVISDSVAPLSFAVSRKRLSMDSRVCALDKIFVDPRSDHQLRVSVELFKFPVESLGRPDVVTHKSTSFQSSPIGRLFLPLLRYSS